MGYASFTQHMDVTPQTIFDYITDPDHLTAWLTLFDDVTTNDDSLDAVGAKFEAEIDISGKHLSMVWEVTKVEGPRLIHLVGSDPHGGDAEAWIEIGAWEGGSEFEFDVSYELAGGFISAIADRVVVERRINRELKRSVTQLADIIGR